MGHGRGRRVECVRDYSSGRVQELFEDTESRGLRGRDTTEHYNSDPEMCEVKKKQLTKGQPRSLPQ